MKTTTVAPDYKGYRFPSEIISHAVWLYFRFSLSFRDVEELMAERGIMLTYETIRQWCLKFGQTYANELKRRRPKTGDKWHLDEVYLKINGKTHYLWRAVDQGGNVLDILVQSRRNKHAGKPVFSKKLKGLQYASCQIAISLQRDLFPGSPRLHQEPSPSAPRECRRSMREHLEFCHEYRSLPSFDVCLFRCYYTSEE